MSKYMAKGAVRSIKNFSKGYSDIQTKVRAATSNDPWGPSGTAMNEIAQATYNHHEFIEIMEMIDKRLNDHGKNWRHVFKALTLLDYCLHVGSENVVLYAKDNLYIVKTLREFQYIDEYGKDQGANVRQKAKDITNLLQDDERLKQERSSRANMRDRMIGRNDYSTGLEDRGLEDRGVGERTAAAFDQPGYFDDESEMQRAIEESKRSAQEHERKIKEATKEEMELAKAIQLSKEEEERRKKAEEALVIQGDTSFTPVQFPQQQQQQGDLFSPLSQQYTVTPFDQFGNGQQQYDLFNNSQNTNTFNTQSGFSNNNPYQQQLLQLQQQQSNAYQQQMSLGQQPLSTTVGSNNPFGQFTQQQSSFGTNGNLVAFGNDPVNLQSQTTQFGAAPFNSTNNNALTAFDSSFATGQKTIGGLQSQSLLQPIKPQDQKYAALNEALARGEGQDTFGNVGDARIPMGTGYSKTLGGNTTNNSNTLSTTIRSNSISVPTPNQANPFYRNDGSTLSNPYSGNFSNSQPNLSLNAQANNGSNLYSTFGGNNNPLSQPSSPFSTSSMATTNTLIDLGPTTDFSSQASKNPFQLQQSNPLMNVNKPKSLNDLQYEQLSLQQQPLNQFGQQQPNTFQQGYNNNSLF